MLRDLQALMPNLPLVYASHNAFAPYGEREVKPSKNAYAQGQRNTSGKTVTSKRGDRLQHGNRPTPTALRASHPDLPIIGVEPALKPAAALSASGHVGVMATRRTLGSDRYHRLQRQVETQSTRPSTSGPSPAMAWPTPSKTTASTTCKGYVDRYVSEAKFSVGPPNVRH
ncbi:MAG: hypothetical protein R3E42_09215 [Burkholderiaceae bacterium]